MSKLMQRLKVNGMFTEAEMPFALIERPGWVIHSQRLTGRATVAVVRKAVVDQGGQPFSEADLDLLQKYSLADFTPRIVFLRLVSGVEVLALAFWDGCCLQWRPYEDSGEEVIPGGNVVMYYTV